MKASSISRNQHASRLGAFRSQTLVTRALALFLFVAFLAVPAASAQTPAASQPGAEAVQPGETASTASAFPLYSPKASWRKGYPHQFKASVRSPVRQVREQTLATLIALVQRPGYDQALKDPEAAKVLVPALLEVYANPRHPRERMMAATAICFIGKEQGGIETLIALSDEDRDRKVQHHARHAITRYYVQAYPELGEWVAKRNGKRTVITQAQIEHARRQQARAERRMARAEKKRALAQAKH